MALKLENHNTLEELKQEMRKTTDGRYQLRVHTMVLLKEGETSSKIRERLLIDHHLTKVMLSNKKSLKKRIQRCGKKLNDSPFEKKPVKLMFMDEMRFGLISNYRRSWSKNGKRTVIANQQEYSNRYLYSAIDPITGNNFHLIGFSDVNASITKKFLEALCEKYPNNHIVMIWDNAPFHRKKELHQIDSLTPIFLPSYSHQS